MTGGYLFRKKETIQYPEDRSFVPKERFRGMFGYDSERCIDCGLCVKACPIDIIFLEDHTERDPETKKKKKIIDRYDIDVKRCMFCGLCEEVCPEEAIVMSREVELATYDRASMAYEKEQLLVPESLLKRRLDFLRSQYDREDAPPGGGC